MRQDVKSVVNNLISKYGTRNPYELCDYTNTIYQICDIGDVLGCYLLIKRQKMHYAKQKNNRNSNGKIYFESRIWTFSIHQKK